MEKTGKALKNVLAAALLAVFVLLNVYGRTAEAGTLAGIRFCVTVIAPSLFIYIVLSKLILGSAAAGWFAKPSQALFLLALGFLCGFPTGAVLARELYDRGGVSAKRASYICAYANNPSLSFVLGFAGERAFPGSGAGWKFSLLIIASSLLNMLVLRAVFFTAEERAELSKPLALGRSESKSLVDAVSESADTMIRVCAMITVFACVGTLLNELAGLSGLPAALLSGFLEFSGGIALCAELPGVAGPVLAAALLGWAGLSVQMQVRAVAGELLSTRMFLCARVLQAAVMALGAFFLFR